METFTVQYILLTICLESVQYTWSWLFQSFSHLQTSPDKSFCQAGAQKSKIVFKLNPYCLPKCVILKIFQMRQNAAKCNFYKQQQQKNGGGKEIH